MEVSSLLSNRIGIMKGRLINMVYAPYEERHIQAELINLEQYREDYHGPHTIKTQDSNSLPLPLSNWLYYNSTILTTLE